MSSRQCKIALMLKEKNPWLAGTVIRGDGRGRGLGFPTANIQLDKEKDRPADGIYAVWAEINNQTHPAVAHVGPRPTFPGATPTIEIHLLDFPDRNLYGQHLAFRLIQKIRDVARFEHTKELVQTILQDCTAARRVLQETDVFRNS